MPRDFLVCERYGVLDSVAAGAHGIFPLLPVPDFSVIDPGIPDADPYDILVKRIVGTIDVVPGASTESIHSWGWRCMPFPMDETAGDVDIPFTLFDPRSDEDQADLQWWAERYFQGVPNITSEPYGLDQYSEHFWAHVDIRPHRWQGKRSRLWPCVAFRNYNTNDALSIRRRVRLYVAYK